MQYHAHLVIYTSVAMQYHANLRMKLLRKNYSYLNLKHCKVECKDKILLESMFKVIHACIEIFVLYARLQDNIQPVYLRQLGDNISNNKVITFDPFEN